MSDTSDMDNLSTTTEESNPMEDVELEVLKESVQGKSKNTIKSYVQSYNKLKIALDKEVHKSSQKLILDTTAKHSTNLNTQAALINVGILIRRLYNLDVKELEKKRKENKKGIACYTKAVNESLNLPTLAEFDQHLDYVFRKGMWAEFIINYLIRHCCVRNQDLVFDIVTRKKETVGKQNFMWLGRGKATYYRRVYKTAETYGEKTNVITDKKFLTALKSVKKPIIANKENAGYWIKKATFKELGEGALLKVVLNDARISGDYHKLNEISQLRGTDVCTLTTSYNIQDC